MTILFFHQKILKIYFIQLTLAGLIMAYNRKINKIEKISLPIYAVDLVEQGEKIGYHSIQKFNWEEFWHLSLGWIISAIIIIAVLIGLTMAEQSENLAKDVIMRLDTLSLMFSLVLSAGLEQVWNTKKHWKYKLTQFGELTLAFLGLIFYLVFSLLNSLKPDNPYLQWRFGVHLAYIVVSFIVIMGGFIARARPDLEVR